MQKVALAKAQDSVSAHSRLLITVKFFFFLQKTLHILFFTFFFFVNHAWIAFGSQGLAASQNCVLDPLEARLLTVKPFSS